MGLPESLVKTQVSRLAPGQKQLVEIARHCRCRPESSSSDEPTSGLTQKETDRLYEVIDGLRAAGVSIIYISHRLAEVKRCADRVTVLRDGKNAGELAKHEINHDAIVRLMVGRDLRGSIRERIAFHVKRPAGPGSPQPDLRGRPGDAGLVRFVAARSLAWPGWWELDARNWPRPCSA